MGSKLVQQYREQMDENWGRRRKVGGGEGRGEDGGKMKEDARERGGHRKEDRRARHWSILW